MSVENFKDLEAQLRLACEKGSPFTLSHGQLKAILIWIGQRKKENPECLQYTEKQKDSIEAECICHRCIKERDIKGPSGIFLLSSEQMIVCPQCGNKRCPRASDHRLSCTGSNDTGQSGSTF